MMRLEVMARVVRSSLRVFVGCAAAAALLAVGAGQGSALRATEAGPGNWTPFLHAVPSSDGTSIDVRLVAHSAVGPGVFATRYQPGWPAPRTAAMTPLAAGSADDYAHTFTGLSPLVGMEGTLRITTTLSLAAPGKMAAAQLLDTGPTSFERAYVRAGEITDVVSSDGGLVLHLSPNSFPADAYIIVMPTCGLPAPLPVSWTAVGRPYVLRASGAVLQTERPALLQLFFDPGLLGGADPNALRILAWDPAAGTWEAGGTVNLRDYSVSQAVTRLTVYTLAAPRDIRRLHLPLLAKGC